MPGHEYMIQEVTRLAPKKPSVNFKRRSILSNSFAENRNKDAKAKCWLTSRKFAEPTKSLCVRIR